MTIVLLRGGSFRRLGVDPSEATVRFGAAASAPGAAVGRRLLWHGDDAAFELTYWCGSCPITFDRLGGAAGTGTVPALQARLNEGLVHVDDVLTTVSPLLPADDYLPMLLAIEPRLVRPAVDPDGIDYFAHEQVATWGADALWAAPGTPRASYYRTFETPVAAGEHLYEFVVPMVPPDRNDSRRMQHHESRLKRSSRPTVLAVSILDVSQPATDGDSADYHRHWALTHFVLDGHHKLAAAARTGRPLQLLALVARGASLADDDEVARLATLRARPFGRRPAR